MSRPDDYPLKYKLLMDGTYRKLDGYRPLPAGDEGNIIMRKIWSEAIEEMEEEGYTVRRYICSGQDSAKVSREKWLITKKNAIEKRITQFENIEKEIEEKLKNVNQRISETVNEKASPQEDADSFIQPQFLQEPKSVENELQNRKIMHSKRDIRICRRVIWLSRRNLWRAKRILWRCVSLCTIQEKEQRQCHRN